VNAEPYMRLADRGSVPVAHITGELDMSTAPPLRDRLLDAVENQDLGLVVDLSEATYVDSAGLNLLFELAERLATRQVAFAVVYTEGGIVERVLALVDIGSVAKVHHSVDAAVHTILGDEDGSDDE
jgi:stage II sporulation protein AA (anti-sigma F factor antagonist)